MAYTAHSDPKMQEVLHETPEAVTQKCDELVRMIREAKRVCVFTGAGVSTAAGIADYRGPDGVWTLQAKGEEHKIRSIDMMKAVPTMAHCSLVELLKAGRVHHLISQNLDGLHRKSGVAKDNISELHGNTHVEFCNRCYREYLRDFDVTAVQCAGRSRMLPGGGFDHRTGRHCEVQGCGGELEDNIIHFGENLPAQVIERGFAESRAADLHIVLGSSLTVSPACQMPLTTKEAKAGNKLVIVNMQRTPLDDRADLLIRTPINAVMERVMSGLGLRPPPFTLRRRIATWLDSDGHLKVNGVDEEGIPASIVKSWVKSGDNITLNFFGHYSEPEALLPVVPSGHDAAALGDMVVYRVLEFQPACPEGGWGLGGCDVRLKSEGSSPPHISQASRGRGGASAQASKVVDPLPQDDTDYSSWFAVAPQASCPHCPGIISPEALTVDLKASCSECGNVGENMLCLGCHTVCCGRHVKQHMLAHHEATSHPMVCGFIDLSFWCYPCEAYIAPSNKHVMPYYAAFHMAKFGTLPPTAGTRVV
eukprot:TRINITY_DN44256_c0_g1_i1.p1 TRINITY_DN44256_c0_g1~~TRINITY_DN44256_c0_g1_i1.p1  ORF type:complete len:534 (+),score=211.02 TRINITY_DN44256_c0_g1_i1:78-1679(+)